MITIKCGVVMLYGKVLGIDVLVLVLDLMIVVLYYVILL